MEKPAAEKMANKSTSLPFSWDTVVQCLNIGNRPLIVSKNNGDVGKIIHEDVIDQKIISNGRLFTQKLITKRIGSSSYLTSLGLKLPTTTTVIETSIVDPADQCSWQQTSNSQVDRVEILGTKEKKWLTVTETSIYLATGAESTFSHKHVLSQSYMSGMLYSVVAEYLAKKGQKRWDNVSSNQTNRLTTSAEQFLAQRES